MVSPIDTALSFQSQALGLRAYRQQVLAANIANADTPNFKARDFNFSSALKDAIAGRSAGNLPLAKTATAHLGGSLDTGSPRLMFRVPTQPSVDGNTVEMDAERAEFSQNAIQYEAGVTFLSQQIRTMMAAVQA